MKIKRGWVAVIEFLDGGKPGYHLTGLAYNPISLQGTLKIVEDLDKKNLFFIRATVLRKGQK
jgi:hypothetical protein